MTGEMDGVPVICIAGTTADRALVDTLAGRLRARGLAVREGGELNSEQMATGRAAQAKTDAALLAIISPRASASGAVMADCRRALADGRLVVPLLVRSASDLPGDLQLVQGVDFSRSVQDGWLALLMVLDAHGLARFPQPSIPQLDAEVVLARLQNGRTPPGWYVSRTLVMGPRQLTRGTVIGSALVALFTASGMLLPGDQVLSFDRYFLLILGAYSIYVLYTRLSPPVRRFDMRGQAVVLTPEGIFVKSKTGYVWASFSDARPATEPGAAAPSLLLTVRVGGKRGTRAMPIESLLGPGMLTQQALTFYADFAARYAPERALPSVALAQRRPAPLLFLSYSRKDSAFVDRLELTLQQCGYTPWVDRSELLGGQAWSNEVRQALDQCSALVVVITPAALRSAEVRREYTYALAAGKPVVGLLARGTGRLPAELRGRVAGDARTALLYGNFGLTRALDDLGVGPAVLTMPPGGHVAREPTLTMARALHGEALPDGHVYRGRLPLRVYTSIVVALLVGAVLLGLFAASGALYFLWLLAVELAALGSALIYFALRRWRYPDVVVTLPDGFITFFGSGTLLEHPFGTIAAIAVGRTRLRRGLPVQCTTTSGRQYTVWLPPTLRWRKRIAEQIRADFARYRQARAPVMAAQPARTGADGEPWRQVE